MPNQEISPEDLLRFVKKSFDVPNDQLIDMMPFYSLVLTVAEWDGVVGQEPQWMIEADEFLRENLYSDKTYIDEMTEEDFNSLSIAQRAAAHNIFGALGNYNSKSDEEVSGENSESLIPNIKYPAYDPKPAFVFSTDYAQDGSSIFKSRCNSCDKFTEYLNFESAMNWINKHNSACK